MMETRIISGKAIAAAISRQVAERAAELLGQGLEPRLAFVLVGQDPATLSYFRSVQRACQQASIRTVEVDLPDGVTQAALHQHLEELSTDPKVHGILLQRPLPPGLDPIQASRHIAISRDVDCTHPENFGLLFLGHAVFAPCTPLAVLEVLSHEGICAAGLDVVIIGRSAVVGRPLAYLLSEKGSRGDATVTLCHSRTRDLPGHTRRADILVCAAGSPGLVRREMIKPGAVVIDVSTNSIPDAGAKSGYRLVGDVLGQEAIGQASVWTPVPGGVGPVTVAMLLRNTIEGAERTLEKR